MYFIHVLLL